MNRLLNLALLGSASLHVAAGLALHGPDAWNSRADVPALVASLRSAGAPHAAAVAARQEKMPEAVQERIPPRNRERVPEHRSARSEPATPLPAASPASFQPTQPSAPAEAASSQLPGPAAGQASAQAAETAAPLEPPRYGAAYLANPPPPYPAWARRQGIEGTVVLEARVSSGGEAREVKLVASAGDRSLDEAALDAVRHWRFVPARRGSQAVEAWVRIPVVYRLN